MPDAILSERRPRADRLRNRERLLRAAKAVFSEAGSLGAVAQRAGVGIGTLYRHFPTREALFEAVYRQEVETLAELADELRTAPPVDALRQWLHADVAFIATKKGMLNALALSMTASHLLATYSMDRLGRALQPLLDRAVDSGTIRSGLDAADLLRTVVGLCYTQEASDWQANVLRLLEVFLAGMEVRR